VGGHQYPPGPIIVHKEKLDYYEKTLECEDEEGNARVFQGIHIPF
jgi:hypothetical protein